jgi:hypothetical protein
MIGSQISKIYWTHGVELPVLNSISKKTEIISIDSKEFRDTVIRTRQLGPGQQKILEEIHIAKDGSL